MKKHVFSVLFMILITAVFSGLVTAVKKMSDPVIEVNRELKRQGAVLQVLGIPVPDGAARDVLPPLYGRRIREITLEGRTIYLGYAEDGRSLLGYAFPVVGAGLWGRISGLAAVNTAASRLIGLIFLRHNETPGLGGRITESWFLDQFKGLTIRSAAGGKLLFTLRPAGASKAPGELDAVTGATITSSAVETFLNRDINAFLDDLLPRIKELK